MRNLRRGCQEEGEGEETPYMGDPAGVTGDSGFHPVATRHHLGAVSERGGCRSLHRETLQT